MRAIPVASLLFTATSVSAVHQRKAGALTVAVPTAKTCRDVHHQGHTSNGAYQINNDVTVNCDFTNLNAIATTLAMAHDTGIQHGSEAVCSGKYENFVYPEAGSISALTQFVTAVSNAGGTCQQGFTVHCHGSVNVWTDNSYHCIGDSQGNKIEFDGRDANGLHLGIDMTSDNCRRNDYVWRQDTGIVTAANLLPITKWFYGDAGDSNEQTRMTTQAMTCTEPQVPPAVPTAKFCGDVYNQGHTTSGGYQINNNVVVNCDFTNLAAIVTTVSTVHDTGLLRGHEGQCSGDYQDFSYPGAGTNAALQQLVSDVGAVGGSCSQSFTIHCHGSVHLYSNTAYHCFGGSKQQFGTQGIRLHSNNCVRNDNVWRQDTGDVSNLSLLPITNYWYGDTGDASETTRLQVGAMSCTYALSSVPTAPPTAQPTDTPTSPPTSRPTDAPVITSAHCSDIVTTERVWNRDAKGVNVASYTGPGQLVWIGCPGNGCDASTFYCKDGTNGGTVGTLEFGTTQISAMRSLHGVNGISDSFSTSVCCNRAGGLCNSPDKAADATALCTALGYAEGTVEVVASNSCPEPHWNGNEWTNDYVNSQGYGKKYICTGYVSPAPAPGVSGDPFTEFNGQKKQFFLPMGEQSKLIQCSDVELFGSVIGSGIAGDTQQWFNEFRLRHRGTDILTVGTKNITGLTGSDGEGDIDVAVSGQQTLASMKNVVKDQLRAVQYEKARRANPGKELRLTPGGMAMTREEFASIFGDNSDSWEKATVLAATAKLTTLRIQQHLVRDAVNVTITQDPTKKIGSNGFVEHADIVTDEISMRMTSSIAHKFTKTENVKKMHLDLDFTRINAASCDGLLPEIWGVKPMSLTTAKLLQPAKEQVQA